MPVYADAGDGRAAHAHATFNKNVTCLKVILAMIKAKTQQLPNQHQIIDVLQPESA